MAATLGKTWQCDITTHQHNATGDPYLDLIAAVYRRALMDVERGNAAQRIHAALFLDDTFPEWRMLHNLAKPNILNELQRHAAIKH